MEDSELEHVDSALEAAQASLEKQNDDASARVTEELLTVVESLQRAKYEG